MTSASTEEESTTPTKSHRTSDPSAKKSPSGNRRPASSRSKSFVAVGLEKKASPSSAKAWSDLSLTLHGRDKITKILQYLARLLAWWLRERNRSTSKRLSAWEASSTRSDGDKLASTEYGESMTLLLGLRYSCISRARAGMSRISTEVVMLVVCWLVGVGIVSVLSREPLSVCTECDPSARERRDPPRDRAAAWFAHSS